MDVGKCFETYEWRRKVIKYKNAYSMEGYVKNNDLLTSFLQRRDLFGAFGRSSICDQAPYVWKFGHNVVLISNHQTEAEPMIIALLLETLHPHVAEKMTYVAGDRVVTDPVCKPFSMGRNLVCVYSKKHMHDIPELAEMKKKANTLSLKEMALLLRSSTWQGPPNARARQNIEMEVRLLGKEKRR
ncbi:glycerol-3-phosphate acyltransferase ATS11, chloroplastic-like isoform X4 [Magnolia sinica]|uniref:glycerol-3-phosphate acyltransferase ATS11, chloroplastic-like isoform X4 n=1 Tax=Magnolia sinica TaxID=86752 RepID=UPI002657B158|nr:glycerol-3-phosphate acyltransferase ATS11, chloroplastic-like isoform X4 [Magnolia sinica]XP_058088063.1 glycerol-3-phosphate acyltransferase ATS11, chloroplastic-like isoform X4 [Magnolia sinica]XP_058088064.1 glycerol-3-phosphate acyltransferase ATS11, chloroplastic-like isoform X4 [Magnolia sinica]